MNNYDCPHTKREFRKRLNSIGVITIWNQCLACGCSPRKEGGSSEQTKRSLFTIAQINAMPWFDPEISKAFYAARNAFLQQEKEKWWARYKAYLDSPKWASKRTFILRRDNQTCCVQGCSAKAVHVHHLSYEHMGNEPPEDLVSICFDHHAEIHPHLRDSRKSMRFTIGS